MNDIASWHKTLTHSNSSFHDARTRTLRPFVGIDEALSLAWASMKRTIVEFWGCGFETFPTCWFCPFFVSACSHHPQLWSFQEHSLITLESCNLLLSPQLWRGDKNMKWYDFMGKCVSFCAGNAKARTNSSAWLSRVHSKADSRNPTQEGKQQNSQQVAQRMFEAMHLYSLSRHGPSPQAPRSLPLKTYAWVRFAWCTSSRLKSTAATCNDHTYQWCLLLEYGDIAWEWCQRDAVHLDELFPKLIKVWVSNMAFQVCATYCIFLPGWYVLQGCGVTRHLFRVLSKTPSPCLSHRSLFCTWGVIEDKLYHNDTCHPNDDYRCCPRSWCNLLESRNARLTQKKWVQRRALFVDQHSAW